MSEIPDDVLEELRWLNEQSAKVRGTTPLDDPSRQAGEDFCKLVLRAMELYGASLTGISRDLGLSDANVRLKLGRRGYIPKPPSQKAYQGVLVTRALQTHCKRGHELDGPNLHIRADDGARVCIACRRQRERENYAKRKR